MGGATLLPTRRQSLPLADSVALYPGHVYVNLLSPRLLRYV